MMGGICPLSPSRRVVPVVDESVGTHDPHHFHGVHSVASPVLDTAVQTDIAWSSNHIAQNYRIADVDPFDDGSLSEEEEKRLHDTSTIVNIRLNDFTLTVGLFFDGEEFDESKLFLKKLVDLLKTTFSTIHLLGPKSLVDADADGYKQRAENCDCFLVITGGEVEALLNKILLHGILENDVAEETFDASARTSIFYGKVFSIFSDKTGTAEAKQLRQLLSASGAIILAINNNHDKESSSHEKDEKSVSELKLYTMGVKIAQYLPTTE